MKENLLPRHFSQDDLAAIEKAVNDAEENTSGEIRVRIINYCDEQFQGDTHKQAEHDFFLLGLDRTREKIGVLILVVLGERKFEVLADEGINAKLSDNTLTQLVQDMSIYFRAGNYREGVIFAVREVEQKLAEHFPRRPDDVDELPDDVSLGN